MNFRSFSLVMSVFLTGCATQGVSTSKYTENPQIRVKNEVVVSKPYSQVWDSLVKEFSKSFYVINNIDKESRIINLSFSSSSPAEYVDCGKTHRTYTQGEKVDVFDYEVAGSAQFKVAAKNQPQPAFSYYYIVRREPTLEGRSNIYIAPEENNPNNTTITVNTRYIITMKIKAEGFAEHVNGNVFSQGRIPDETTTVSFNTNQIGQIEIGNGEKLTCFTKGKLEKEILDMTNK